MTRVNIHETYHWYDYKCVLCADLLCGYYFLFFNGTFPAWNNWRKKKLNSIREIKCWKAPSPICVVYVSKISILMGNTLGSRNNIIGHWQLIRFSELKCEKSKMEMRWWVDKKRENLPWRGSGQELLCESLTSVSIWISFSLKPMARGHMNCDGHMEGIMTSKELCFNVLHL